MGLKAKRPEQVWWVEIEIFMRLTLENNVLRMQFGKEVLGLEKWWLADYQKVFCERNSQVRKRKDDVSFDQFITMDIFRDRNEGWPTWAMAHAMIHNML